MQAKWIYKALALWFFATAAAKFYTLLDSDIGEDTIWDGADPIFGLKWKILMAFAGILETGVGTTVMFADSQRIKDILLLAISSVFIIYRTGIHLIGYEKPCSCLGSLTAKIPFSENTINYTLMGSLIFVAGFAFYQIIVKVLKRNRRNNTRSTGAALLDS